jgi:hypothetical protein
MKNFLHRGRMPPANSTPVSKTPVFQATTRDPFRRSLKQIVWLATGLAGALVVFGSPALWVGETWNSRGNPVFRECTYLNLFTGFERLEFRFHDGDCPVVRGFRIKELAPLYDFYHQTEKELFHDK